MVLMGYLTISTNVRCYQTHQRCNFSFRKTAHWCTCIVHATQSNCCGSRLHSSWTMPPTSLSWTHWLQDLGSHTAAWVWVVSQKDWRNQGATRWILHGNALIQHLSEKIRLSCFPVLPDGAEAHVIWDGTVKRLLMLTLSVTFLPKKYQNPFMCVKLIVNQRWDVFETQCI